MQTYSSRQGDRPFVSVYLYSTYRSSLFVCLSRTLALLAMQTTEPYQHTNCKRGIERENERGKENANWHFPHTFRPRLRKSKKNDVQQWVKTKGGKQLSIKSNAQINQNRQIRRRIGMHWKSFYEMRKMGRGSERKRSLRHAKTTHKNTSIQVCVYICGWYLWYLNGFMNTHPVSTTIKSSIFHTLRRYDPLWSMRPKARIFSVASTQKIPKK